MTPVRYEIDPQHSAAQFKIRHLMISNVKGEFTRVTGSAEFDPASLANSSVEATIDATSINTREPDRDQHLKSADFFDVTKYPAIKFRSKRIAPSGNGSYDVTGDLTIRDVTREVTLAVEDVTPESKDPWGNLRRGATASTTIDRKDFGLTFNMPLDTGGVLVGDEVHISIDVEVMRKAQ